jgi:hypothetical protein
VTTPEPSEQPAVPTCTATGCSHAQAPGALLCPLDVRRLGDMLAQLGTEYELLSAVPSMQGREVGSIGGSTLAAQRSPGRLDVIALRSRYRGTGRIGWEDADVWGLDDTPSVYSTLATYAEQVREARQLTPPRMDVSFVRTARPAGPVCDPDQPRCGHHTCEVWTFRANVAAPLTVASERRLLATHLAWILGQDWAGEFFDDIHSLWAALRSANGQGGGGGRVRRFQAPCGTCQVRAVTLWPGDDQAVCENCGTTTAVNAERMSA